MEPLTMPAAEHEAAKIDLFLQWLQANGGQLRGCTIKHCGTSKGFGVFPCCNALGSVPGGNGVLMVVPLDLAITPMRVLQDASLGTRCAEMFKEGDVDDRFLMTLFLTVERLRRNSPWKPYIDMLPRTFNNPLWFTEDELSELKGTTLYRASLLQKRKLQALFVKKVRSLVVEILCHEGDMEDGNDVQFEDFLWANSVFWSRAMNIPFPHSYIFPSPVADGTTSCCDKIIPSDDLPGERCAHDNDGRPEVAEKRNSTEAPSSVCETVWVEGLIPGIDFCNHGLDVSTTWEVDKTGHITGVPSSMYLRCADLDMLEVDKEIYISYGNKGNEELLYLYGFVMENNPDEYLMVHYPIEALQNVPFSDSKARLLETQKAELRCLLPKSLLDHGFFPEKQSQDSERNNSLHCQHYGYSWSGQRKVPSYLNKLIFPEEFLSALRTISLQEDELRRVFQLLEELVGHQEERQPSARDVQAAVWEASGDFGALSLLVDILQTKMTELEECSGTEACDSELLDQFHSMEKDEKGRCDGSEAQQKHMNKSHWSSIVYRHGQKLLTRLFLKEAEHALELCSNELP